MLLIVITSTLLTLGTSASVSDCTNTDKQLLGSLIRKEDDVASMDACVTLCQAETDCQAAVWRTNNGRCFLKECGYEDLSDKTNSNAVELCCLAGTCDTCDDSCETCCTGLDSSWDNVETTTSFSVKADVTVDLTCDIGYDNKGDSTVTCVSDTSYTGEPDCQKDTSDTGWLYTLTLTGLALALVASGYALWICCIKNGRYKALINKEHHQCQ